MNHIAAPVWRRRAVYLSALLVTLLTGCLPNNEPGPVTKESAGVLFAEPKSRGVCWVGGRTPVEEADFLPLVENHVSWIVQTPFGWQPKHDSPELRFITQSNHVFWGETDVGLETTTRLAKQFGIKTLLKPHIWLRRSSNGKWRADIEMKSEAEWQIWFQNYTKFMLHHTNLAQQNGIEALCIGTELSKTTVHREKDWRRIIGEVRKVYDGKLTYSANWYREFEQITFWDELDFIGVQAYFPLSDKEQPTVEELKLGWKAHLDAIEKVHRRFKKPVLFTEAGYRSTTDAAVRPWEWGRPRLAPSTDAELATQANCYEALFQSVWHKSWFAGAFIWKWFPKLPGGSTTQVADSFSPQNKPAEKVMAKWYGNAAD